MGDKQVNVDGRQCSYLDELVWVRATGVGVLVKRQAQSGFRLDLVLSEMGSMTLWESARGVLFLLLNRGRCCLSGLDRRIRRHSRSDCSSRRFGRLDRRGRVVRQAGAV